SYFHDSLHVHPDHPPPHSLPTRRSSDLPHRHGAPRELSTRGHQFDATRSDGGAPLGTGSACGGRHVPRASPRRADAAEYVSLSRSEEHTSELQSRFDLVCRLLLEKKNKK